MVFLVKQCHFEGPLDLLLHLIRKNHLDICTIAISQVTNEFLNTLDEMRNFNLEIAGDYLVMAATLIHIKSRLLLPVLEKDPEVEDDEDDDRGEELVQRLKEYRLFQETALMLDRYPLLEREVFTSGWAGEELREEEGLEVDLFHFLKVCREVLTEQPIESIHQVEMENLSVAQRIEEIKRILASASSSELGLLLEGNPSPLQVVVTLLAILELVKVRVIRLIQHREFGPIEIWPVT
ncbi:MAG: segregation/condensation protein A [Deltaproteobacteria bacterium]|nr:segregation/condensation protein A [Deltaproteobacteria bacterium]